MFASALPWIGPLSLILAALGASVRDWHALRVLALASGALGVGAFLPALLGAGAPLPLSTALVATWLALCAIAVASHSIRSRAAAHALRLTPMEEAARRRSFNEVSPADFRALLSASTPLELPAGAALYADPARRPRLYCLVAGALVEHVREGDLRRLGAGALIGEAGWVLGAAHDNVADLRADVGADAVLLAWDYTTLDRLVDARPSLRAGLLASMAHSLARPGEWLDPPAVAGEDLDPARIRLQSLAFPSLTTEQFALVLALGETVKIPAGTILDTRMRVAVIGAGTVRISRSDGHYLDLGEGSFLGELGWAAPDRLGKEYVVVKASTEIELTRWSYTQLTELRRTSPRLYAGVMHGVARDVAVKLSLPMQKVRCLEDAKGLMA